MLFFILSNDGCDPRTVPRTGPIADRSMRIDRIRSQPPPWTLSPSAGCLCCLGLKVWWQQRTAGMYRQAAELPGCSVGITLLGRIYAELHGLYVSPQYLNPLYRPPHPQLLCQGCRYTLGIRGCSAIRVYCRELGPLSTPQHVDRTPRYSCQSNTHLLPVLLPSTLEWRLALNVFYLSFHWSVSVEWAFRHVENT